jgi:hypothetical protein
MRSATGNLSRTAAEFNRNSNATSPVTRLRSPRSRGLIPHWSLERRATRGTDLNSRSRAGWRLLARVRGLVARRIDDLDPVSR